MSPDSCHLLGSPIGNPSTLSSAINQKISALKLMGERLSLFSLHDSVVLLRSSSIPRLMFMLRTSPLFTVDSLKEYDVTLCSLLSSLLNVAVVPLSPSWSQASLPVRLGGLGFQSAVQLAPSCYLSLAAASRGLVSLILSNTAVNTVPSPWFFDDALASWSAPFPSPTPPTNDRETIQREWDHLQAEATFDHLLNSAPDDSTRARLLPVSAPESGAWLHVSSLGLRLDDVSVRISVALRLGLPVCVPHACKHCGTSVSSLGLHGLSCKCGSMRFTGMLPSMTSFSGPLVFLLAWSLQASRDQMINVRAV